MRCIENVLTIHRIEIFSNLRGGNEGEEEGEERRGEERRERLINTVLAEHTQR